MHLASHVLVSIDDVILRVFGGSTRRGVVPRLQHALRVVRLYSTQQRKHCASTARVGRETWRLSRGFGAGPVTVSAMQQCARCPPLAGSPTRPRQPARSSTSPSACRSPAVRAERQQAGPRGTPEPAHAPHSHAFAAKQAWPAQSVVTDLRRPRRPWAAARRLLVRTHCKSSQIIQAGRRCGGSGA